MANIFLCRHEPILTPLKVKSPFQFFSLSLSVPCYVLSGSPLSSQPLLSLSHFDSQSLNLNISQVTVWGDYGRMDKKVFMGVAQILLDDLDLSNIVIGWYKLFPTSSLFGHHSSTTGLNQSGLGSSTSLETLMSNRT